MNWQQTHKDFRLNGRIFTSVKSLLGYSKIIEDKNISFFLTEWFSDKDYVIAHTSGSTGKPKPITILKKHMINSAKATAEFLKLPNNTKALLALSTQYIAGKMMLVRAIINGWKLDVVNPSSTPLNGINKTYNFTALVPLQVQNSLDKLECIDKILIGGGAVSVSLLADLQKINSTCFASYGMTETITHIAIKQLNGKQKSTYYQTLPNVSITVDNRNCLVIDAPKIASSIIVTNDLVNIINKHNFQWLGRVDNVINSGGIKLIPEQIEKKLSDIIANPFFVFGQKDDLLGKKLILIIEDKENLSLKNRVFKLDTLEKFQKPKAIYFLDKFEYTETKKINRKKTISLLSL